MRKYEIDLKSIREQLPHGGIGIIAKMLGVSHSAASQFFTKGKLNTKRDFEFLNAALEVRDAYRRELEKFELQK